MYSRIKRNNSFSEISIKSVFCTRVSFNLSKMHQNSQILNVPSDKKNLITYEQNFLGVEI